MDVHEPAQTFEVVEMLTAEEDMFCLAVVEYGGNLREAWVTTFGACAAPAARAKALMLRPHIAHRIEDLQGSIKEGHLISVASHLTELANIRDMSKNMGAVNVALQAEIHRGKVAGYYAGKGENTPKVDEATRLERLKSRLLGMMPDDVTDVPSRESAPAQVH